MAARSEEWELQQEKALRDANPMVSVPSYGALDLIAGALAKAQGEMANPGFDTVNPHFRNKFASLAAVRNAVVPIMAKHGIFVSQDLVSHEGAVSCTTILTHSSGQQMRFGPLVLPVSKNDAQGFGSAATYCRRYSLMAVACVVGDDDDDANAATGKPSPQQAYEAPHKPQGDVSHVNPDTAFKAAVTMREILEMDISDDMKALKVLDRHDVLVKDNDLYIAASAELSPSERKNWKAYVAEAKHREKEDRAVSNVGRRF